MLGKIIGTIGLAFAPVDFESSLADSVTDPEKTHVNSFGSFLFDRVVGDAAGGVVVCCYRCRRLGMAHFVEGDAEGAGFFAIRRCVIVRSPLQGEF